MKKFFINFIMILCILAGNTFVCYSQEYNLSLSSSEIKTFKYQVTSGQGRPQEVNEDYLKWNYNYSTGVPAQIAYVVHYLNSFHFNDDGITMNGADGTYIQLELVKNDNSVLSIGFSNGRFRDAAGKQYGVDSVDYLRFTDFIYALKTEKLILPERVLLEPSEWARVNIERAIENELVPKWNQIDYRGDITRLEACQLVGNFLETNGTEFNPVKNYHFADTFDPAIENLYSLGIINGKSETEFCPYDYITREEAAKILSGLCDAAGIEMNGGTGVDYADKDQISDWAVDYVEDMTAIGVFNGDDENKFNPQDNITKEELISILVRLNDNVQANTYHTGAIYVNDIKINGKETILTRDDEIFIPLRTVLEALSSEVIWDENTKDIYFNYANTEYICEFAALNSYFPEEKRLLISKVENKGSTSNSDYIQLNPMSADGAYCEINDRIYLYQETAKRLMEALGCNAEIETDPLILKISTK